MMTPNINPHPYPIATAFHPNPSPNNVESSTSIKFDGRNGGASPLLHSFGVGNPYKPRFSSNEL
jgi:hypothetical protein